MTQALETQRREPSLAFSSEGRQINPILKMLSPAVLYQTTSLKLFGWLPTFCFPQSKPPYSWAEWFPKPQTCEVPLTSPFISDPGPAHIPRMMRTGELSVRTQWWQQRAPAEMAQNSRLESLWLLEGRLGGGPLTPPCPGTRPRC